MSRSTHLNTDDIIKVTQGGLQIFQNELGGYVPLDSNVHAPWRDDPNPSIRIKENADGVYKYVDYGGDLSKGGAIDFVMKKYGISFGEALGKIKGDLGIDGKKMYEPVISPRMYVEAELLFEFNEMPFTKLHHKYWNKYELSEDFVTEEGDIYAVKKWAVNKVAQTIPEGEIMFAYVYRDYEGKETGQLKFLRLGPNVEKRFKWRTNVPNDKLWYLYKYLNKDVKKLFISKSNKDRLCLVKQQLPTINIQSENAAILEQNMPMLLVEFPELILNLGGDKQAREQSKIIANKFGVKEFFTPTGLSKEGINDNSDYIAEFGEDEFINLLKQGKIL